ncbi:hypothetical protein EW026_g8113 [Hermanssonia centrifuga]|uniref:DUF6535 domain-containing protein n=1 Tax=Hermanssonia centrifuga TaxID=98765 RepID=A0A4S4K5G1_9APHY|nr:hypothetical protein EW026_g8113 [Hermanssonia centrifuga]
MSTTDAVASPDNASTEPKESNRPLGASGWAKMSQKVREVEEGMIKDYKEDIDTLLVFAGLFSAVMTAFIIESYKTLQEDPSLQVLKQIATQTSGYTQHNAFLNATTQQAASPPFEPQLTDIRINALWFASLIFSLVTASLGMLVKQWLREYLAGEFTSGQARLRTRHFRSPGIRDWKVLGIAAVLPHLLQLSLALFFAGLCLFTSSVHPSLAKTSIPLVSGWALFIVLTTIAPAFSPRCPYKTTLLKGFMKHLRRYLYPLSQFIQLYISAVGLYVQDQAYDIGFEVLVLLGLARRRRIDALALSVARLMANFRVAPLLSMERNQPPSAAARSPEMTNGADEKDDMPCSPMSDATDHNPTLMPVLASNNGQMSSGVSSRSDHQEISSIRRRFHPVSTRTSPGTKGEPNPFEGDEIVRRRIEAMKKVFNAISRPFKSVRTSVSTWMIEHGPDEIEEDEIVRKSSSDLDVLAAVDAIQSDDELLATVVREAVWQIQPEPYADTTINFILEIIGHRLQRNGQVVHLLLPLDLSALTERAWHAVTEMAAELLKREVRRQLTQANNGDYTKLSWKPWMSTALLLLMSKSQNCVSEDGEKIIQHCIQHRFNDVHMALTSRLDPERTESALRDSDMISWKYGDDDDDEEGAFSF